MSGQLVATSDCSGNAGIVVEGKFKSWNEWPSATAMERDKKNKTWMMRIEMYSSISIDLDLDLELELELELLLKYNPRETGWII